MQLNFLLQKPLSLFHHCSPCSNLFLLQTHFGKNNQTNWFIISCYFKFQSHEEKYNIVLCYTIKYIATKYNAVYLKYITLHLNSIRAEQSKCGSKKVVNSKFFIQKSHIFPSQTLTFPRD